MFEGIINKKRSVVYAWLISYVMILLIPVIITGVTYIETSNIIEKEINNSNTLLLKRIQKQMDSILIEIEHLGSEVSFNSRIRRILQDRDALRTISPYDMYELINDLRMVKTPDRAIDHFYIYFSNGDMVLSNINSLDSKSYYEVYIKNMGIEYEKWMEIISGRHRGEYFSVRSKNQMGQTVHLIAFIQTIPVTYMSENTANMVVMFDESRLSEDIKDTDILKKGGILVIDKNDSIIASTIDDEIAKSLKYEDLNKNVPLAHRKLNGIDMIVSYSPSDVASWKYIVMMPESVFWEKSSYVRKLSFGSIIVCVLLGSFITFYSLKKNYNPVEKLVKLLEKYEGISFGKGNNEYTIISDAIDKVHTRKREVDSILIQQNKVLKSAFISRLLKGGEYGKIPAQEALPLHGIKLKSDFFAVILFYIDDFGKVTKYGSDEMDEAAAIKNFRLAQFIMTNVVEELAGRRSQGFMTDVDNLMACLVNFNEESIADGKDELNSIAKDAADFLSEHFNISLMISASSVNESLSGIPMAYNEALQAMEYKRILGIEEIVHYGDIREMPKEESYFSNEMEMQLVNYIRGANFDRASIVFNEMLQKAYKKTSVSVDIVKCVMFNIINTITKTGFESATFEEGELPEKQEIFKKLFRCKNINELKDVMLEIIRNFCSMNEQHVDKRKKGDKSRRIKKIEEYIQSNYTNSNMTITEIADFFEVHPVYLSKVFREVSEEGLLDYINRIRVERAKQLIMEQHFSLEDLSKAVGFCNTKTFTRAFKKYVGTTPGRFKESYF